MCSDVFKTILTSSTWPESHSKCIVLQEEAECVDVFEDFPKYMYNGHVSLEKGTVLPIMTLADKYNVADLSKSCLKYMCAHCVPVSQCYVVAWLQYAIICGHKNLEEICRNYILYNFGSIMHTREFGHLTEDILVTFLKSSDLVVVDEYSLYSAMKTWLRNNSRDCNHDNTTLFHKVMHHVRFPMMHLKQLAMLEADPLVEKLQGLLPG